MEKNSSINNLGKNDSSEAHKLPNNSIENSDSIREDFFVALEKTLIEEIDKKSPKLEKVKVRTLEKDDREIAIIEQKRNIEKYEGVPQNLWLVVDFDDVINHTSSFMEDLYKKISQNTNITIEKLKQIYDQSKISNDLGKKVFRFNFFIEKIKNELENKQDTEIDNVINNMNYGDYIDQSVRRSLIASRFLRKIGSSGSVPATVRISILTYGDPEYQKFRVEKSGIGEIVDEVIYTESSKREVVDLLTKSDYEKDSFSGNINSPYLLTFDDSPEQIDDLKDIENSANHINVRFYNPQAKRYKIPHSAEEVVKSDEDSLNQAALDMFEIARISLTPETHQLMSQMSPFDYTKNRELREKILSDWGSYRNENIKYFKDGNSITRKYDNLSFSSAENAWKKIESKSDSYGVTNNGTLDLKRKTELLEEYIKGAIKK
ncbi:MAG: hypothetical protein WCG45_05050 [bacterium]